jgi:hypothetical protein
MPTTSAVESKHESEKVTEATGWRRNLSRLARRRFARELLIFLAFCLMTALMTWPWVLHLRDAVADIGDPYMIAWSLWWDFHQTFHDPLHLFNANVFYPYQYTLAFSENDYGLSLLFFPLFAAGVRTLTIHSIATFLGFAFCGYSSFRLTRTLTASRGAAWVAGVVFAFIPFRFHLLSHLHYLFAGWIPLLLEALVLFARERSWRRAAWLGAAFLMNALTCISWFILTLAPLALTGIFLLARNPLLRRDRDFWLRAAVSLTVAALALLPFLLPYYWVTVMYGLKWQDWEFALNSPTLMNWLAAERRAKLWEHMGEAIPGGHKLFPGLLAPLLAIAALRLKPESHVKATSHVEPAPHVEAARHVEYESHVEPASHVESRLRHERLFVAGLDLAVVLAAVVAVLALGYRDVTFRVFGHQVLRLGERSVTHAVVSGVLLLTFRFGFTFRETARGIARRVARVKFFKRRVEDGSERVEDGFDREGFDHEVIDHEGFGREAFGIALIWTVWGFLSSLGANFFLNRILHDNILLYRSIRFPSRSAMVCYVGLAVLAGMGAVRLARLASRATPRAYVPVLVVLVCALGFELRAFPLQFDKGVVEPDAITLRLKQTPMRGGLVELPSDGCCSRHRYMLRAADHERPLVNATASFTSPITDEINRQTSEAPLPAGLLNLLESIPASYLVIHNADLPPDRHADYEAFLARGVATRRLRFINRFDGRDDLYAVVKTEPDAKSEAAPPAELAIRDWTTLVEQDPVNLLGQYTAWSQALYRLHFVAHGRMPRYTDFLTDARETGRELVPGFDESQSNFEQRMRALAEELTRRADARVLYEGLDERQYVERVYENAGLAPDPAMRDSLAAALSSGAETRAGVLLKVAEDPRLVEREQNRSLLLLHYFGFLRRNPDDAPDHGLEGFNYWLAQLERSHDPNKIALAFKDSIEYKEMKQNSQ